MTCDKFWSEVISVVLWQEGGEVPPTFFLKKDAIVKPLGLGWIYVFQTALVTT